MSGNVPNLTDGRFLRGSATAGATGGAEAFTIGNANMPSHSHDFSANTSTVGNHSHSAWTDAMVHMHTVDAHHWGTSALFEMGMLLPHSTSNYHQQVHMDTVLEL
jgi:microcystin-dependent protein